MSDRMKGRVTLKGVDSFGWAAAIDAVLEERVKCPELVEPREDNSVLGSTRWLRSHTMGDDVYRPKTRDFTTDYPNDPRHFDVKGYYDALGEWQKRRDRAALVRVRLAAPAQLADLARAFGSHFLTIRERHGQKDRYVKSHAFPAAKVFAVFAAIWGDRAEDGSDLQLWKFRGVRYLEGYSSCAVNEKLWTGFHNDGAIEENAKSV